MGWGRHDGDVMGGLMRCYLIDIDMPLPWVSWAWVSWAWAWACGERERLVVSSTYWGPICVVVVVVAGAVGLDGWMGSYTRGLHYTFTIGREV